MELNELLSKTKKIDEYINLNNTQITKNERVLLKAAKLPEEVWEFYNELLKSLNFARKQKWEYSKEELEKELMDVLITTLVLANELEIDVEKQLTKKLDIIFERFNLN